MAVSLPKDVGQRLLGLADLLVQFDAAYFFHRDAGPTSDLEGGDFARLHLRSDRLRVNRPSSSRRDLPVRNPGRRAV